MTGVTLPLDQAAATEAMVEAATAVEAAAILEEAEEAATAEEVLLEADKAVAEEAIAEGEVQVDTEDKQLT